MSKWRVQTTKSKLRWVAWRVRKKRRTGRVFETWRDAVTYALCMCECDARVGRKGQCV